jgi:multiple sugar transport system ATP-binding protein
MAKVELRGISKVYDGNIRAMDMANITVEDKEFVVFVGPSGCGKSTILRMIAGLEDITDGELLIDGELMNDVPPKDRNIAMVFQNYALYPHMSVYDNMAFALKIKKTPKAEIKQRLHEAAAILDIEQLLDRKPKSLSGGQRQRVAVGRAIVRNPKVFLFDEPLSNLDARLRVTMRAEISALHQRLNATMIYVTHDQTEAMTMADRIVVFNVGKIKQIGTPMHLYNYPSNKFVAGFIGSPPMNFINVKVVDEDADDLSVNAQGDNISAGNILLDGGNFKINPPAAHKEYLSKYAGKEIWFGIRPEDLRFLETPAQENNIPLTVKVVEPLGAETMLRLQSAQTKEFVARVEPKHSFKLGDTANFQPNMEKAHYFDKDGSEESILPLPPD